jgi:hypothetical protein
MKTFALIILLASTAHAQMEGYIRRPRHWRPPPAALEAGIYRRPSSFVYNGHFYRSFEEFRGTEDWADRQASNRIAALQFELHMAEQDDARRAAVDFGAYRSLFPHSTHVLMDESALWATKARWAHAKLGTE